MGVGPDICQNLWSVDLNEMFLGFRCICVWVEVSQVSQYPREIKIMLPGQTPGLVIPNRSFGSDRQTEPQAQHVWIYYVCDLHR